MKKILIVVTTNYQLFFAEYISQLFKAKNIEIHVILSFINSDIINENKNKKCFNQIYIISRNSISNPIKVIKTKYLIKTIFKKVKPDLLIVFKDNDALSWMTIQLCHFYRIENLLIEEGLGLYTTKSKFVLNIKQMQKKLLSYPNPFELPQGYNKKIKNMMVNFPDLLSKEKTKNKNIHIIPKVMLHEKELEFFNKVYEFSPLIEKGILYLGQPLTELGLVVSELEIQCLKHLQLLSDKNNLKVYIKPHPSENINKYLFWKNAEIIEGHLPAELIILNPNDLITITPFSSAAVNVKNWSEKHVIFIYNILGINNLDPRMFNGEIVKSISELDTIFNNIIKSLSSDAIVDQKRKINSLIEREKLENIITSLL